MIPHAEIEVGQTLYMQPELDRVVDLDDAEPVPGEVVMVGGHKCFVTSGITGECTRIGYGIVLFPTHKEALGTALKNDILDDIRSLSEYKEEVKAGIALRINQLAELGYDVGNLLEGLINDNLD